MELLSRRRRAPLELAVIATRDAGDEDTRRAPPLARYAACVALAHDARCRRTLLEFAEIATRAAGDDERCLR